MVTDEVRIQHVFRDPESGFTDAIVLPKADYEKLSEADIEAVKAERVAAHVERLANPPVVVEPTKAEVEAEAEAFVAEVESRRVRLVERLAVVKADVSVLDGLKPVDAAAEVVAPVRVR